ncbi:unnamed protein product [Colias eurytheme]|nr:unnamed protein product [Colias eurytheme]
MEVESQGVWRVKGNVGFAVWKDTKQMNESWRKHREIGNNHQKKTLQQRYELPKLERPKHELLNKNRTRDVLKENDASLQIKIPMAPRPPDAVRYDNTGHFPVFVSYGRCKYFSKRNCFYNYHVQK